MTATTIHLPDGTLRVEREYIDVTMVGGNWKYDPGWTYVDRAGHHHLRDDSGFPTLISVIDDVHSHDGDECVDSHLACSLCWEPIEPGVVPAPSYIVGRRSFYFNDQPISQQEAEKILGVPL